METPPAENPSEDRTPASRRGPAAAEGRDASWASSPGAWLALALLVGAVLRLLHWVHVRDEPFIAQLAMDAQEYDRWAREILRGESRAGPFFQPPLYPHFLAAVYALFGPRLDAVYLAQIALAVAGLYLLFDAGRTLWGVRAGVLAAGFGALYAPAICHEVQVAKEGPGLALLAGHLACLARASIGGAVGWWALAGLSLALVSLLRENFLLLFPLVALLAARKRPGGGRWLRLVAVFGGAAVALLPVALHNQRTGAGWLPTTFQGGVNFWIGNHPGADGTYQPLTRGREIPRQEREEAIRLAARELGRPVTPAEASRFWFRRSLAWARQEPGEFLRLQVRKLGKLLSPYEWPDALDLYWLRERSPVLRLPLLEWGSLLPLAAVGLLGLGLAGKVRPGLPLLAFWLAAILATAAFFLFSRYRLLLAPPLLLLLGAAAAHPPEPLRTRRSLRIAVGVSAALLWIAPRWQGYEPRRDLVEYNLGRLAEDRKEPGAAEAHYAAALEANPEMAAAWMNAGKLAARRGDLALGLERIERATRLSPGLPEAWANLGIVRKLRGETEAAREALLRALALDPELEVARRHLESMVPAPAGLRGGEAGSDLPARGGAGSTPVVSREGP